MTDEPKIAKKRGRKPKGGKITEKKKINETKSEIKTNIILHLRCNKSDIKINNDYDPTIYNIEPYENDRIQYDIIESPNKTNIKENESINKGKNNLYDKLNQLENDLHKNNINKKSHCFWCSHSFDTPTIYIPRIYINNKYEVYGNFCSPECAAGYLFNESIIESFKFQRYQLLNYIYGEIYNYNEMIKLAPSPYYLLEKYQGNLTIQEYRQLLNYDRLLLFTDKPLTKIYPELHEDNNNFEPHYRDKMFMKKVDTIDKEKHIKDVFQVM